MNTQYEFSLMLMSLYKTAQWTIPECQGIIDFISRLNDEHRQDELIGLDLTTTAIPADISYKYYMITAENVNDVLTDIVGCIKHSMQMSQ